MAGLIAHRGGGQPVGMAQAAHAGAAQDVIDGRGRVPGQRRQAVRSVAAAGAGAQDGRCLLGRQLAWRAPWPAASIEQPGTALGAVAAQPLVGGRATDAELLGHLACRPTQDRDPGHQQLTTKHGQTRVRMSHESLRPVWVLNTSHRAAGLSFVNNVFGNYI